MEIAKGNVNGLEFAFISKYLIEIIILYAVALN